MKSVYLVWQEPQTQHWLPVGKLTYHFEKKIYQFTYIKGAEKSSYFVPFGRMKDLHKPYFSTELFPLFANRLLSKSRPEYPAYLQWLNIQATEQENPILLLARSGGQRATDSLEIFPSLTRHANGHYEFYFFSRELRRLPKETRNRINLMSQGEPLRFMPTILNEHQTYAITLQADDLMVGFSPPYLIENFWSSMAQMEKMSLTIAKVNPEAPLQFRLWCHWQFSLPENYQPFSHIQFQELCQYVL
ncbi:conserved hypothetical protein [Beggiatoa sp. PS]|nr:conserved hypothetical protein [Beggiatoa sp. PS]